MLRLARKAISLPARWRLDHDVYALPVELWINQQIKKGLALKPAVDSKRLARTPAEAAAC
jgi:hypothetical protein